MLSKTVQRTRAAERWWSEIQTPNCKALLPNSLKIQRPDKNTTSRQICRWSWHNLKRWTKRNKQIPTIFRLPLLWLSSCRVQIKNSYNLAKSLIGSKFQDLLQSAGWPPPIWSVCCRLVRILLLFGGLLIDYRYIKPVLSLCYQFLRIVKEWKPDSDPSPRITHSTSW